VPRVRPEPLFTPLLINTKLPGFVFLLRGPFFPPPYFGPLLSGLVFSSPSFSFYFIPVYLVLIPSRHFFPYGLHFYRPASFKTPRFYHLILFARPNFSFLLFRFRIPSFSVPYASILFCTSSIYIDSPPCLFFGLPFPPLSTRLLCPCLSQPRLLSTSRSFATPFQSTHSFSSLPFVFTTEFPTCSQIPSLPVSTNFTFPTFPLRFLSSFPPQ